ncbi:DUF2779 domain-containing protein [Patescibacteria group bacterium]|nr:DUF2779 domain-containing protein [Patescibacteria group bacterium]
MDKLNMTLSKSDYMLFLRHPAWLWLKKFDKYKLPPIDDNLQAMFDAGHEFESHAEKLFPDAVKLGFSNYNEYLSLPQRTADTLDENAATIFQGRFEVDGLTCIVDVLNKVEENTFDLVEIKSSTKVKPEHFYDLAFQTIVLEKSGLTIRNISVMHVNNEYVRRGGIEPEKLVTKTDVTENVKALIDLTKEQIKKAFEVLAVKEMPDISPRYVNQAGVPRVQWFTDWLDIYKSLKPDLDIYSIYSLSYPSAKQIGELEDADIKLLSNIPEDMALQAKQVAQIQTTRDNKRIIDKQKIKEFLETFQYPLYFLDYETFSSVIPFFDGCKPYADYPFQYSLHILDTPDSELRHEEYLHAENSNPMPGLIKKLKVDIGKSGTILTWHMPYEKGCNDTMASFYPEHEEFFESLNQRINDLKIPFSEMWFVDKGFLGTAKLKNVLPILAPELSYKALEVQDGLASRRQWTQTVLEGKNQNEREKIMSDLSKYCTLDTFAMVRILEELEKIVSN